MEHVSTLRCKMTICVIQKKKKKNLQTCLAANLIRAKVLAVVEEVAAQSGTDASAVSTQELVLLTRGNGRWDLCGHTLNVYFAAEGSTDFTEA